METYHRKRSKRSAASANNENMSLKWQETGNVLDCTQRPPLGRQWMVNFEAGEVPDEEIEVGSVYEMYHKNLPPRTPVQLMHTRVVMVSEKTDFNVGVRYPSSGSLRAYFSNGIKEMYPALDEKFVMGTKLAKKVLLRQVPSREFAEKKHLECFWLVKASSQVRTRVGLKNEDIGLARELKKNMVSWGVRRQVMFVQSDKELSNTKSSSSFVQGDEQLQNQPEIQNDVCQEDEEIDDQADEEENDDEAEDEIQNASLQKELNSTRNLRKRKNHLWKVNKKPMKKCRKLVIKDPTNRWSKERYMAGEVSLLEAMKEKNAMIGNPITRPALRVEARKRIGDTGLLDHLLKHVANKVAPGGTLRFRRSHNAEGVMEYWLEDADLVKIRKDAGVNDPFWIPPSGWKPGDSPTQDPIVAKEINHLKQVVTNMKRETDEEIAKLRSEIQELASKNKQDGNEAIVVSEHVDSNLKKLMDILNSIMLHPESGTTHHDVANSIFPKALMQAEPEVGKETTQASKKGSTELITATVSDEQKKPKVADKNVTAVADSGRTSTAANAPPPPEGKAAKIERLKSAFRIICRPQGTIRWPNMANSSCATPSSQVEDLLVVPTPPSVSSITPPQPVYHRHLSLPSPVRPVPERRPITLTLSTSLPPPPSTTTLKAPSSQLTLTTPR